MSNRRKAQWITGLILVAALGVVVVRKESRPSAETVPAGRAASPERGPQDAVLAMLDAARQGDTRRYLGTYTGRMEADLRQAIADKGEAGFSNYLRQWNAPIKGIAVSEPQAVSPAEVKLRIEYVYQDRNEAQTVYLEKVGSQWKISRLENSERVRTPIPYGTPVQ